MSYTNLVEDSVLKHLLKIAAWIQPTNLYVAAHIATTLNAQALAAATSIVTDADVPDGSKIVIDPLGTNTETFYAGTVTGVGPYTVPLLDAPGGVSAALVNTHAAATPVKFAPGDDGTLVKEPTAGTYARVLNNTFNNPVQQSDGFAQCTNTADINFALASDAAWGKVTHVVIYDALTAGNALIVVELDTVFDVVLNARLRLPASQLKIKQS